MRTLILRHRAYRGVWTASALSSIGTQVSAVALPLAALLVLHATVLQVSLLSAVEALPVLLLGLPLGALVDRLPRRPVMVCTDAVRALALASVPLSWWLHGLSIWTLYASGFVVGAASIMFDAASQAFLPSILPEEELAAANGGLQSVGSVAYAVGPGIAGPLVQAFSAPYAVLVDVASYLWSAAWLGSIGRSEPRRERAARAGDGPRPRLRTEILDGVKVITGNRALRSIVVYNSCAVLFLSMERAVQMVFLVRDVHVGPTAIGLLTGIAAIGAVLGGLSSSRVIGRFGELRTMLGSAVLGNGFMVLIPLAAHGPRVVLFAAGVWMTSFGIVVFTVASVTYRQQVVPRGLLGRIGATTQFSSYLLLPVGSVLAGVLGGSIGVRPTLWISAIGLLAAAALLTPLRRIDPAAAEDAASLAEAAAP